MVGKAIERGAGQQVVGKGGGPFLEGAIAGDDERGPLVAFGDDLIEVLRGLRRKGLQAKVVENQEIHGQHLGQEALMRAVGACRMQVCQETVNGSGQDTAVAFEGFESQCVGQVTLAYAGGATE